MLISMISASGNYVSALITWENSDRQPSEITFESSENYDLTPDPNGFLLACYLPAWNAGETRVAIDQGVCPILRGNLSAVTQTLSLWYPHMRAAPPIIEARDLPSGPQGDVASFLSGGIDSLATIRSNHLALPPRHPERISSAILIDYRGISGVSEDETDARFRERSAIVRRICADASIQPISIITNARTLDASMQFWMNAYHGSLLAGTAYFLRQRLRKVHIASTFDARNLSSWGSHPLLDPYYSSSYLQISHHGLEMSRFEKTALVADWPIALSNLNVCVSRRSEGRNCGQCEKCIRTMLALLGLDKLTQCEAFHKKEMDARDLEQLNISNEYQASCYRDLVVPLRVRGRNDLSTLVETKLSLYMKSTSRQEPRLIHSTPPLVRRISRRLRRLIRGK